MPLLRRLSADQKRSVAHCAMELIIVVAGVLIALWMQEWVERRRALEDMHAAEDAVHDEIRQALTSVIWRDAISQCHLDRANLIKAGLLRGGRWPGLTENAIVARKPGGRYAAPTIIPSVYQRPVDNFTNSAWNSALATGALAPMERERFSKLVALYDQIQLLSDTRKLEDRAAEKLTTLAYPMELTPQIRFELLQALYDIDRFTFSAFGVQPFVDQMRALGWNDKEQVDHWIVEEAADDRRNGLVWRACVKTPKNPFS